MNESCEATMQEDRPIPSKDKTRLADRLGRPLSRLRISVTDRCNLRCRYCMPEADYPWLPREGILRFEEIDRLVDHFLALGTRGIRLTGGEPLLRRNMAALIQRLSIKNGIEDLSLTTNGLLLREEAPRLRDAGLHRVTVSLDTLRPERFYRLTGRDELARVLEGIEAAQRCGFSRVKINTVVIRGLNDDEYPRVVAFGKQIGAEVRLIEYMDVGGATQWSMSEVVPAAEMLERLEAALGPIKAVAAVDASPSRSFRLEDGTVFGIIASTTAPFCRDCDRSRLTADGQWYRCLYSHDGMNLRDLLRSGATDQAIQSAISGFWRDRTERGAEDRLGLTDRGPLYPVSELRGDPHLEMHTRGG